MSTSLKFRCKITDLTNSIKKHVDIENVVIENEGDVEGVINSLLGVIKYDFHVTLDDIRCRCRIDGTDAIVELAIEPDASETITRAKLVHVVKKLQDCISSANK